MAVGAAVLLALAVVAGGGMITLPLAAAALALGAVIGLVAAGLQHARYGAPRGGAARGGRVRTIAEAAALCLVIEGLVIAWGMAESPAIYAPRWYASGGAARTAQLFAADVLGAHGVILVALALALAYVGPRRLVPRARAAVAVAIALLVGSWIYAARSREAPTSASAASAPARGDAPAPAGLPPNILLVVVEGMRADRLDARTAPALDRLASRGARFDRAYASTPERLPALATLLTGRHAHHHGLRSEDPPADALARDLDALPARLARAGYATAALGDDGSVLRRLDLGFQEVDAPAPRARDERLARQTPLLPLLTSSIGLRLFPAMRSLRETSDPRRLAAEAARRLQVLKQRPFLLTVAFSTTLAPYVAPAGYAAKYMDRGYRGRFRYAQQGEAPADAADAAQIRALHDASVRAVDDGVALLLAALADEGVAERTLVVVTSGHGERLFENGRGQGHGGSLLGDESLHVPLVVFDPRRAAPLRSDAIVRDVDLAATLYELAAVAPPSDLDGRSLVPLLDRQPDEARYAFAEGGPPAAGAEDPALPLPAVLGLMSHPRMIRDQRFKLVYAPTRKRAVYALFDTVADPAEIRDLLFERLEVVDRLRPALLRWMLSDPRSRLQDDLVVPSEPLAYDLVWITARESTPAIDALAKRGVRFTQMFPAGLPLPRAQLPIAPGASADAPRALVVAVIGGEGWKPSQLVIVAPGRLPAGITVDARVRDVDLVPTLSELLGRDLDAPPGSRSLVGPATGSPWRENRPILTVHAGAQYLLLEEHRLVVQGGRAQLYLATDLELRHDLAKQDPDRVGLLRAYLEAELANVPVAGSDIAPAPPRIVHLRFVTAGRARRVTGFLTAASGTLSLAPIELGGDAFKISGTRAELAFTTSPEVAVGFDLIVDPPATNIAWQLFLDDHPWPDDAFFAGPYGLLARSLRTGLTTPAARATITSPTSPTLDPHRDLGIFIDRQ